MGIKSAYAGVEELRNWSTGIDPVDELDINDLVRYGGGRHLNSDDSVPVIERQGVSTPLDKIFR